MGNEGTEPTTFQLTHGLLLGSIPPLPPSNQEVKELTGTGFRLWSPNL